MTPIPYDPVVAMLVDWFPVLLFGLWAVWAIRVIRTGRV